MCYSSMANIRCCFPESEVGKWAGHQGGTNWVAWVPNHQDRFISCGMDSKIKLWDSSKSGIMLDVVDRRDGHSMPVRQVSCSLDGSEFVTAGEDKFAIVFDTEKASPKLRLHHKKSVQVAKFPSAEEHQRSVITVSSGKSLSKWDLRSGNLESSRTFPSIILFAEFINSEADCLVSSEKSLDILQWKSLASVSNLNSVGSFSTIFVHSHGNYGIAFDRGSGSLQSIQFTDNIVCRDSSRKFDTVKNCYGALTGSPDSKSKLVRDHAGMIQCLRFRYLTMGDSDGNGIFWELKSGRFLRKIKLRQHCSGIVWNNQDKCKVLSFGKSPEITMWQ